ncbi:NADPH-dependent diflavin oxidoreductase 1 [Mycena indigotica]|uniref:NADPH-dependent diflavin oxidoreductase 1 n=1 Tax=Mycena indigotica TaxID=2126181 RepID=A0A8H6WB22_9AGAR|nr:NADPH-dependent diflavin oxidoreductase 1 [Mycena indigotica]KAF7312179.1 NADPH-dependent diflavin oxidoreductase 1 [Mycena indigotica]
MDHQHNILILYATETGSAQHVADQIALQCRRIHIRHRVLSTDSYSLSELISETIVLFVVATTGSGAEPRTMSSMWNALLRSDLPTNLFEDLCFAVFGLGDSAYEKFCWPAKKLSRRLQSLGAQELLARGEGDDQHLFGVDGALEPWLEALLDVLLQTCPLPPNVSIVAETAVPAPRVSLRPCLTRHAYSPQTSPPSATVKSNHRITSKDWNQDVRHLEFEFHDDIHYRPGDIAVIRPKAPVSEVNAFLDRMGWLSDADVPFQIEHHMESLSLPSDLPQIITLRELFTEYLDLNAVPRRSFFRYLRHFTQDELEREKLEEFLTSEGADELYEYCFRVRRTIAEVLADFRHVTIPRNYMFDVFPPLRPRRFSIASSVKAYPRQIHLCVAVVKYRTKLKVPRRGICSTYLASLTSGDRLQIAIQPGLLKLPVSEAPIICIGPGTGVAPMRSIIQERECSAITNNTLYFGCRSALHDQHYGGEWAACVARGTLTYRTAFSRDGPEGTARVYVQHILQEDSEEIWRLLCAGATVFISGSSNKMPAAVKQTLVATAEKHAGLSAQDANEFISRMETEGKLIEECWS